MDPADAETMATEPIIRLNVKNLGMMGRALGLQFPRELFGGVLDGPYKFIDAEL